MASHPFGGGNAGGKMNCYTLASNLGLTLRVVADMEEGKLPSPMAREYLQAGARAIMQMWRDLEEQEQKAIA
ncbi:hypothetical protein AD928_09000 [Acetobacter cerevisiae]|uniref:Uncharacterized protein n=2 Tax=Acetobacter cerevisiae TaxID=178900 RepID=A0A149Q7X9_9PROT|nr:hypothetical protein AD928_09000 [Acetobacter cerevisiae]GBQ10333.1 hypothetical protein AA14362_2518 [Acetobacter cerevisiae DSM 14362]